MNDRRVAVYYAWSRPDEIGAPLEIIENRFPALFESRRMQYPRFEELSDPSRFDQGVAGFLDHILKVNFSEFVEQARAETGQPVIALERVQDDGSRVLLDDARFQAVDTLIVISFDSLRTGQQAEDGELRAMRAFLARPGNLLAVCPHHDIGDAGELAHDARLMRQEMDFLHHGDWTIPPQQGFGGFGRSLLAGLGVKVENRFGLRPACEADGAPAAIEVVPGLDRLELLRGVPTFNHHPHLPHFAVYGEALQRMEVLARQRIDPEAPPHVFTAGGQGQFDALLQSRAGVFAGDLIVGDATLWSSTAGGLESLRQFWTNVVGRKAC